jgi:hypothetical protein
MFQIVTSLKYVADEMEQRHQFNVRGPEPLLTVAHPEIDGCTCFV